MIPDPMIAIDEETRLAELHQNYIEADHELVLEPGLKKTLAILRPLFNPWPY